ncbi:hypothetical protein LZ32DRAFT_602091 [Colletotrichum eremochloae]|nr:hypothetical protein LZ32DRAFT_602091 [Colletotrichum eremochloae]
MSSGLPFSIMTRFHLTIQRNAPITFNWTFAEEMMKQGFNVIVDSTCNFQEILDQGFSLCEKYNFTYWYIECHVDDIDLLDERLRARQSMKSQRTSVYCPPAAASSARVGEDSRAVFRKWIESPCRPERNAIIVNSRGSPETQRNHILARILGQRGLQLESSTIRGSGDNVDCNEQDAIVVPKAKFRQ